MSPQLKELSSTGTSSVDLLKIVRLEVSARDHVQEDVDLHPDFFGLAADRDQTKHHGTR